MDNLESMKNTRNGPSDPQTPGDQSLHPSRIAWGEQADPWVLNYVCAINGLPRLPPGEGFTYCEVGCGEGGDLVVLAASNPGGNFIGIDLRDGSSDPVRNPPRDDGVHNCGLHRLSPAELEDFNSPAIDFLVLTGALAFPDRSVYRAALSFAATNLKPGGVVLCSYRTPHAWALWEPVIHFLRVSADSPGNREENIRRGIRELEGLRESGAALFQVSPLMNAILESLEEFDAGTLDEAFLRTPFPTFNFDEICRDMESIGLRHGGSLPVGSNYARLSLPPNLLEQFSRLSGLRLMETWKDLARMPFFRRDIFTSPVMPGNSGIPEETVFGSQFSRERFSFHVDVPGAGSVRLEGPVFQKLADIMAENARTLSAVLSAPSLEEFPKAEVLSAIEWMNAMEQIRPFAAVIHETAEAPFRLSRFNRALMHRGLSRRSEVVSLASRTLGNGVNLSPREALAVLAISEAGPENAEAWAGKWLLDNSLHGLHDDGGPTLGEVIKHAVNSPGALAVLGLSENRT